MSVDGITYRKVGDQSLGKEGFMGFSDLMKRMGGSGLTVTSAARPKGHTDYRAGSSHTGGNAIDFGVQDSDGDSYMTFFFGADANFKTNAENLKLTEEGKQYLIDHNAELLDERGMHPGGDKHGKHPHFHLEFNSPEGASSEWDESNFQNGTSTTVGKKNVTKWGVNNAYYKNEFHKSTEYTSVSKNYNTLSASAKSPNISIAQDSTAMKGFAESGYINIKNEGMDKSLLKLIKDNEGFDKIIRVDIGGTDTIGYGFTSKVLTGKDGKPSMSDYPDGMTKEQADEILEKYVLPEFINQIKGQVPDYDKLSESQRNTLVDLTYRNGIGNMESSGIFSAVNSGDFKEAQRLTIEADSLNKVDGVVLKPGDKGYDGIRNRNTRTAKGFSTEVGDTEGAVDLTAEGVDLNVAPEGETKIEKFIRISVKAKKNETHDITTGPAPYELSGEELQFLIDTDIEGSSDYISQKERIESNASLIILNDGDASIVDSAKTEALVEASKFATGDAESVIDPETGETVVQAIPTETTGGTAAQAKIEEEKQRVATSQQVAIEAKHRAEQEAYAKKVAEGTATQEEKDAAMAGHEDRLAKALATQKEKEDAEKAAADAEAAAKLAAKEGRRDKRMRTAEKVLTGLKAAAGLVSLSKALRDPEVETPELSPLIIEAVDKQRQLAKSGFSAAEKASAMNNLNDAYAGAMKNVLRASGGQRGLFLANQGTVDANRISGLNQLAAEDAKLHRQNIQQYNQLASSVGQMTLSRDMSVEQMRQATMSNNRKTLSGIGSNLVSDALSDVSWYMNPNRDLIEQATRTNLEGITNQGKDNTEDPKTYDFIVGGASFTGTAKDEIAARKQEAARLKALNK